MKCKIAILLIFFLSSCGGGDSDSSSGGNTCGQIDRDFDIVLETSSVSGSITINEPTNVSHLANNTAYNVASGSQILNLYIQGNNNSIVFEQNSTVEYICISGSFNSISVPTGTGISIDSDTGNGNMVFEY